MKNLQTIVLIALLLCFCLPRVAAQKSIVKSTREILLGETPIKINIYQKSGNRITFFAPHHNEQTGRRTAKQAIAQKGGRLIEIESLDENGEPLRRLKFAIKGESFNVDPNRIFTDNGRLCGNVSPEAAAAIKSFADNLLKIILSPTRLRLRNGEILLVAVHNNGDVDEKNLSEKPEDLTALAFAKHNQFTNESLGAFHEQTAGVYLSNAEDDLDNFYFLSSAAFLDYFAAKGFNAAVQKSTTELQTSDCKIDDGSLSVFAGQRNIAYINIEADAQTGEARQKRMIAAVYELLQRINRTKSKIRVTTVKRKNNQRLSY